MGVASRTNTQHNPKQKAKARKSGPSFLRKAQLLGKKGNVLSLALYQEPTHNEYRLAAHIPKGKSIPDLNAILANYLAGRSTPIEPRTATKSIPDNRPRTRSACRKLAQSSPVDESSAESVQRQSTSREVEAPCVRCEQSQTCDRSSNADDDLAQPIPATPTSILNAKSSQKSVLSSPGLSAAKTCDQEATPMSQRGRKSIQEASDRGGAAKIALDHAGVENRLAEEPGQQKMSFMEELMDWVNDTHIDDGYLNSGQQMVSQAEPLLCSPSNRELTGFRSRNTQTPNSVWRLGAEKLLCSIDTLLGVAPSIYRTPPTINTNTKFVAMPLEL